MTRLRAVTCMMGGWGATGAGCNSVRAGSEECKVLNFFANGPALRRDPGTQGNLVTKLNGRAELYPRTGKIIFIYHVDVDFHLGHQCMPC